jgi:hypothetical protein
MRSPALVSMVHPAWGVLQRRQFGKIEPAKGCHDVFRPELERWNYVLQKARQLAVNYGYDEVREGYLWEALVGRGA